MARRSHLQKSSTSAGAHPIAALIVTYFPDAGLPQRLDALLAEVSRLLIVDNGSDDASLLPLKPYLGDECVSIHRNEHNEGIATALNQGLRALAAEGFKWVITFDQDSKISPGFVPSMLSTLESQPDPDRVALIGPNRKDTHNNIAHRWVRKNEKFPIFFERVECAEASNGVTLVITSGALTSISAHEHLGGFRDDLFIDLVDVDYCLRAQDCGYRIMVSCGSDLTHRVGQMRRTKLMGVNISAAHHSPLRKYYLFRNSVALIRSLGCRHPHWLMYHLMALAEVLLGTILFETNKIDKLRASVIGVVDGIAGKLGPARRNWTNS